MTQPDPAQSESALSESAPSESAQSESAQLESAQLDPAQPDAGTETRRSGLRNPEAAVRGLGAGTLVLEAIVLLLAIQPIRIMGGDLSGFGVAAVITLAVLSALVAGMMKRPFAWGAGTVIQVLLLACGLLHWSLAGLGLIFGAAWGYAAHVRRTILG